MKKIIICLLVLCALWGCFGKTENPGEVPAEETAAEEVKELPFVEAKNMTVSAADKEYENPAYGFIVDEDYNILEVPEIVTEAGPQKFRFHNLRIENADDGVIYSFDYDTSIAMVTKAKPTPYNWYYVNHSIRPVFFDYYSGNAFKENNVSLDNGMIIVDNTANKDISDDNFAYTEVSWDGTTHKVGIYQEVLSSWDPEPQYEEDGWKVYKDKSVSNYKVYIKTDKEYDGLMIGILKTGADKQKYLKSTAYYSRYNELLAEAEKSGKKSEELLKYEERINGTLSLLESAYDESLIYEPDDYFVIRVAEIPVAE